MRALQCGALRATFVLALRLVARAPLLERALLLHVAHAAAAQIAHGAHVARAPHTDLTRSRAQQRTEAALAALQAQGKRQEQRQRGSGARQNRPAAQQTPTTVQPLEAHGHAVQVLDVSVHMLQRDRHGQCEARSAAVQQTDKELPSR